MKFLDINGLSYFLGKLKTSFVKKEDFDYVVKVDDDNKGNVINARQVVNNQTTGVSNNYDLVLGNQDNGSYILIDSTRSTSDSGSSSGTITKKQGNINIKSTGTARLEAEGNINIVGNGNEIFLGQFEGNTSTHSWGLSMNDSKFKYSGHRYYLELNPDTGSFSTFSLRLSFVTDDGFIQMYNKYFEIRNDKDNIIVAQSGNSITNPDEESKLQLLNSAVDIRPTKIKVWSDSMQLEKGKNIKFKTSSSNTMRLTEGEGFKVFANMYAEPDHATDISDYTDEEKKLLSDNTVQKNILDINKKVSETSDVINDIIDTALLDSVSYGIEWTEGSANSAATRVGNMTYHKTLPIQSKIRGCVHQHGVIQYYLDPNDWSKKADGSASRLDGYDGEVGLVIPKFYIWSYTNDGKCGVRIAKNKFVTAAKEAGGYILAPWCASCLREVPSDMGYLSTLPKNSLVCIKNSNTYCRGGDNKSNLDTYYTDNIDVYRSLLNKPVTNISRATARTYAKNAGNLLEGYHEYKDIVWLYYIEYANFDCQSVYNATPTAEGYKQGGLGAGCTTFKSANWYGYNYGCPIIPNGEFCEKLGNNTGCPEIEIPSFSYIFSSATFVDEQNLKCAYYRGIQNFFGGCWQNLDRVLSTYNSDDNKRYVYTTDDTEFADNVSKMTKIFSIPATEGWINTLYVGNSAELLPDLIDNSTSSKSPVKDYCYSNSDTNNHLFLVGGNAADGALAGLTYSYSIDSLGAANSRIAFRTITKIKE